jgi:hypothetical protein
MSDLADRVKPYLPRVIRAPLAAMASYARGRRVLNAYTAHYQQARAAYAGSDVTLPERFGVRVMRADEAASIVTRPDDYRVQIARIAAEVSHRFERTQGLSFFPRLPAGPIPERTAEVDAVINGDVIIMRLVEPAAIGGIAALSAAIVGELERKLFGCHAIVDRLYVYRSPVSRARPRATWLWHYDNYPREILKVMIYLTDVAEDTAPFEYLRHRETGQALPGTPLAPGYGDSRISDAAVTRLGARGYEPCAVSGATGTMLIFDNNVVHRATLAQRAHRDVLVLQVRPSRVAGRGVVDPRWTGSFQHSGFNLDPDDQRLS